MEEDRDTHKLSGTKAVQDGKQSAMVGFMYTVIKLSIRYYIYYNITILHCVSCMLDIFEIYVRSAICDYCLR